MSDEPKGCEYCGRHLDNFDSNLGMVVCARCADILNAGFEPPFKCQQCGAREDLHGHVTLGDMSTRTSPCDPTTQPITQLSVSLHQASRMTGLSERTLRRLVARGTLQSKKVGARRLVSFEALSKLVT
jgi:excisionase family DNA binding protein